jgi:hypothetical protein
LLVVKGFVNNVSKVITLPSFILVLLYLIIAMLLILMENVLIAPMDISSQLLEHALKSLFHYLKTIAPNMVMLIVKVNSILNGFMDAKRYVLNVIMDFT